MNLMNVIEVFQFNKEENNDICGNFNPNESLLYSRLLKLTDVNASDVVKYSKTISDIYGLIYSFQKLEEEKMNNLTIGNLDKKHSWLYDVCVEKIRINPSKEMDFEKRNIILDEFRL